MDSTVINKKAVSEQIEESSVNEKEVTFLPKEILVGALKYAERAIKDGRMIPHEKVKELIAEKMGWN
jgi:hypothetical protein